MPKSDRKPRSMDRRQLDRQIAVDGQILSNVVKLLTAGTALVDWPATETAALGLAMWPKHANRIEHEKARRLRRHLFVDIPPPPFPEGGEGVGRWSDRIRADLPDLVPFATGLALLTEP